MTQTARDSILERLRSAQDHFRAASLPDEMMHGQQPFQTELVSFSEAEIYKDYHDKNSDLLQQFCEQLTGLKGEPQVVSTVAEAGAALAEITAAGGLVAGSNSISGTTVLLQDTELLRSVLAAVPEPYRQSFQLIPADTGCGDRPEIDNDQFSRPGFGVTECDLLIARSGGIALRTVSAGGRRLSVLPEHHIVVARAEQIVAGLLPWYEMIVNDSNWSYGVVITGPSRTSDIEKILVLGAHGPKRLSVIIIR